jgi:hypothetical protein
VAQEKQDAEKSYFGTTTGMAQRTCRELRLQADTKDIV